MSFSTPPFSSKVERAGDSLVVYVLPVTYKLQSLATSRGPTLTQGGPLTSRRASRTAEPGISLFGMTLRDELLSAYVSRLARKFFVVGDQ